MVVSVALVGLTLRLGLAMRRLRGRGGAGAERGALMKRHMRLGRPAVVLVCIGFVGGPLSAWWLRDWTPLGTLHGWLGVLAAALFATTGYLGRRLMAARGEARSKAVEAHARAGLAATLLAALASVAGFVLLP